jgi:PPM family protein phosphatase
MTLALRYAVRSDVGLLREGNEDSAYAGPHLLAVADGMGGHAAGEVASSATIATIADLDTDQPAAELLGALANAVASANMRLQEMIMSDPATEGMGTTLTALLWSDGHAALCHIGDSRAYLLRDGQFYQITHDHTLVQSLVDEGRITEDDVATHPQRSLLLRALDGRTLADPDLSTHETIAGDRYLLCSDGLSGVVTEQTLHQALSTVRDPDKAALQLVELALKGGGPDNITCIVADVVDPQITALPPTQVPVMAGAASAGPPEQLRSAARQNSPAGRAGLLRRTAPQVALPDDADTADWEMPTGRHAAGAASANGYHAADDSFDEPKAARRGPFPGRARPDDDYGARTRHGRRRRVPIVTTVLIVFIVLVVGGLYGSWRYVQGQYYLGVDHGYMAIFRGVNTSVAGMSLHSPYQRSSVQVAQLPANAQIALNQTISSKGLNDAQSMVKSVETVVGQCRQQWQQLAAWKTADDRYQQDLTRYNQQLAAVNQHNAHLKAGQKPTPPPTAPARPGPEPQVPQAGSCGPASAFGIAPSALPPGTSGTGSVTPGPSPTTLPTATASAPASTGNRASSAATGTVTGQVTASHPANVATTVRPAA